MHEALRQETDFFWNGGTNMQTEIISFRVNTTCDKLIEIPCRGLLALNLEGNTLSPFSLRRNTDLHSPRRMYGYSHVPAGESASGE
jgi:hypothetical protein